MTTKCLPILSLIAVLVAAPLAAAGPISGQQAVDLITAAMRADGQPAPAMAAPLRALPACDHLPDVAPKAGDWAQAVLSCHAPNAWERVLRTGAPAVASAPLRSTDGSAPASGAQMVLTLARPVPRGGRITADDLTLTAFAGLDPAQVLTDPAHATGRKLRLAVGAGQALLERHLEPRLDVQPQQSVMLLLHQGPIEIVTSATALTGGRIGDLIDVQPAFDGPVVEATITAAGIVQIRPNIARDPAVINAKRREPWSE